MSTQLNGTPVNGMPADLAASGWQLFLTDSMEFRAGNEGLALQSKPYATATEAIAGTREVQTELDEVVPADMAKSGWALRKIEGSKLPYQVINDRLDLRTPTFVAAPAAFERARELEAKRDEEIENAEREAIAAEMAGSGEESDAVIEEAKASPAAERARAVNVPLTPGADFDPYTMAVDVELIDPEVALHMRDGGLNMLKVAEYKEAMLDGAEFPPADVFFDLKAEKYWLAGGAHRLQSAIDAGTTKLLSTLHAGTKRDALIWAAGENKTHGLARTNADKRLAVEALLRDDEWVKQADSVIARHTGVSQPFVGNVRETLETQNIISSQTARRGADGVVRETAKIGNRAGKTPTDDRQTSLVDIGVDLPSDAPVCSSCGKPTAESSPECIERHADSLPVSERVCRTCFCTEDNACEGGCTWVEDDLCSQCQTPSAEPPAELAEFEESSEEELAAQSTRRAVAVGEWSCDDVVAAIKKNGGSMFRGQLEERGCSYAAILTALHDEVITQPETGKYALPSEQAAEPETPAASLRSTSPASEPAPKSKPTIEELLKGGKLSVSFTWGILPGKVNVSVNAGDPHNASRELIAADKIRHFPDEVQAMIVGQLMKVGGGKYPPAASGAAKGTATRTPATRKKPVSKKKPAAKKKAAPKKAAKKSAGRKR